MFAALAAVAMVGVANAAKSYGIFAYNFVKPYAKYDTDPCNDHGRWYKNYVMKQEDAQAAMGTQETVTYATMAEWLGKNFADNRASVIANAEEITYSKYKEYATYSQYNFDKGGDNTSDLGSAIGVFFYCDDDNNLAYNVVANRDTDRFYFDDSMSAGSGWTAVVPEPTSALLLLLGVAGLALKRKRA